MIGLRPKEGMIEIEERNSDDDDRDIELVVWHDGDVNCRGKSKTE